MYNDAAVYLRELVSPYQPRNTLRSAINNLLEVKRTRTKETARSLSLLLSNTCDTLASVKRLLKTHFFCIT